MNQNRQFLYIVLLKAMFDSNSVHSSSLSTLTSRRQRRNQQQRQQLSCPNYYSAVFQNLPSVKEVATACEFDNDCFTFQTHDGSKPCCMHPYCICGSHLADAECVGSRTMDERLDLLSPSPTGGPSNSPTKEPSRYPSKSPSQSPTNDPSETPSSSPSQAPSASPSMDPSEIPSLLPTNFPSGFPSRGHSNNPSLAPTQEPSTNPTLKPSENPSAPPSNQPSLSPSKSPSTNPSLLLSANPSFFPSSSPSDHASTEPTIKPSMVPSVFPSWDPTADPSVLPSFDPSREPTMEPSHHPSVYPTLDPTMNPSVSPTVDPSRDPTIKPSMDPSVFPSWDPTADPSVLPSFDPSREPTMEPSHDPSVVPSLDPTADPSISASADPSREPTMDPSLDPSVILSVTPSSDPSREPTKEPSHDPTKNPSMSPSDDPSREPTKGPTADPSVVPSLDPSVDMSLAPSDDPSLFPSTTPTQTMTEFDTLNNVTYNPGNFSMNTCVSDKEGRAVLLSNGLTGRAIAYKNEFVSFANGEESSIVFHEQPDGAATFAKSNGGGFYLASNSEEAKKKGGVYSLEFDSNGNVVKYFNILNGTSRNCGGGRTPWGTWISCEENGKRGRVHQCDPTGVLDSQQTSVVEVGGHYESFSFDTRYDVPTFYTTEDSDKGALVRFTPNAAGMACFHATTNVEKWCTLNHGTHDYLQLNPKANSTGDEGTFVWVTNKTLANPVEYPFSEGIDVVNGLLHFTTKKSQHLYILNLDAQTYTRHSTKSGAFDRKPDQITSILNDPHGIVYFCEEGGKKSGVHGRDLTGKYFSILDNHFTPGGFKSETTGLTFSPNAMYMFVAFQEEGVLWQFWRTDGLPFSGSVLDIKYHADTDGNGDD